TMFAQALDSTEQFYGPHHPRIAEILTKYAVMLRAADRSPEAMSMEARALVITGGTP
ncbi:MAG: tetratricopeptide repeat protein, partial [Alphaproteobacteria bacterium]|nr:tetratricopeptide repeat protein [Alphaproteobacteria bacterium]